MDVYDSGRMSPLHYCVSNNHYKFAQMLLARGAHPDICDSLGRSAIHLAVDGGNVKLVELLCKNYTNVNIRDPDGNTPLHWAAQADAREVIKVLLQYHADPMIVNNYNMPPPQVARQNGFDESAQILLNGQTSAESEISPLDILFGAATGSSETTAPAGADAEDGKEEECYDLGELWVANTKASGGITSKKEEGRERKLVPVFDLKGLQGQDVRSIYDE